MKKVIHQKTIPEKYGHHDVFDKARQMIYDNHKIDHKDLFRMLPYIGFLRIDVTSEFAEWWGTKLCQAMAKLNRSISEYSLFKYDHATINRRKIMKANYHTYMQKVIKKELIALIERDDILICGVTYVNDDATDSNKQQVEIEYVYVEK